MSKYLDSCTISDSECVYCLKHGGKEGGLTQAPLQNNGEPDWEQATTVDWLRLPPREELYLRTVLGMLIALEWMQGER